MDLPSMKKALGRAWTALNGVGTTLKTKPAAGLFTALAAGFIAGRIFRRNDETKAAPASDK